LRTVWHKTGHEGAPTRAQANEFLQNVDENIAALQESYKTAASFQSMSSCFLQMVKCHGYSGLATKYYERLQSVVLPEAAAKETISDEDTELIRGVNVQLAEAAMQANDPRQAQQAILALLAWGTTSSHCPQRRSDFRLLKWTDVQVADGKATLCFECSAKVGKATQICIAEHNPMLSALLVQLKQSPELPEYLISDQLLGRSTINKRLETCYKNAGLDARVSKLASSTNNARHRSVADGPKRMRMSNEDEAESASWANQRLHSISAATNLYAQDCVGVV
jgi:hypothetical protein